MEKRKVYIAEFTARCGRLRFVGEGKTMPFDIEQARHFETAREARAALASVARHHKRGTYEETKSRMVTVNKPEFMRILGL